MKRFAKFLGLLFSASLIFSACTDIESGGTSSGSVAKKTTLEILNGSDGRTIVPEFGAADIEGFEYILMDGVDCLAGDYSNDIWVNYYNLRGKVYPLAPSGDETGKKLHTFTLFAQRLDAHGNVVDDFVSVLKKEIVDGEANALQFLLFYANINEDDDKKGGVEVTLNLPAGVKSVKAALYEDEESTDPITTADTGKTWKIPETAAEEKEVKELGASANKKYIIDNKIVYSLSAAEVPCGQYSLKFSLYADANAEDASLLNYFRESVIVVYNKVTKAERTVEVGNLNTVYTIKYYGMDDKSEWFKDDANFQESYTRFADNIQLPKVDHIAKKGYTLKGWYKTAACLAADKLADGTESGLLSPWQVEKANLPAAVNGVVTVYPKLAPKYSELVRKELVDIRVGDIVLSNGQVLAYNDNLYVDANDTETISGSNKYVGDQTVVGVVFYNGLDDAQYSAALGNRILLAAPKNSSSGTTRHSWVEYTTDTSGIPGARDIRELGININSEYFKTKNKPSYIGGGYTFSGWSEIVDGNDTWFDAMFDGCMALHVLAYLVDSKILLDDEYFARKYPAFYFVERFNDSTDEWYVEPCSGGLSNVNPDVDFYLPSVVELLELSKNVEKVNKAMDLKYIPATGLPEGKVGQKISLDPISGRARAYWSSSQHNEEEQNVWSVQMKDSVADYDFSCTEHEGVHDKRSMLDVIPIYEFVAN